jgi:hypothetical protein
MINKLDEAVLGMQLKLYLEMIYVDFELSYIILGSHPNMRLFINKINKIYNINKIKSPVLYDRVIIEYVIVLFIYLFIILKN